MSEDDMKSPKAKRVMKSILEQLNKGEQMTSREERDREERGEVKKEEVSSDGQEFSAMSRCLKIMMGLETWGQRERVMKWLDMRVDEHWRNSEEYKSDTMGEKYEDDD